ncbi:MAG: hypothetical protein CO108_19135 [Deltaproteobacteria bacterium CG_4_9_14_3_um_filter_63_12]|nr:MAG: hypothetical protein CO108_19135 [Deltaproteobacteria bacterium CG_4_9_14_3_um_filter_63_12]
MKITTILVVLIALTSLSPVATGQEAGGDDLPAGATPVVTDIKNLSSSERLSWASELLSDMNEVRVRVEGLLEQTRAEEQDVLKLNCINERLSAIKGFTKVAEKANVTLRSLSGTDEEKEIHQAKLIGLSGAQVQQLGEEAESCYGQIVQQVDDGTKLKVKVADDLRDDGIGDVGVVDTTDIGTYPYPDVSPIR